MNKIIFLVFFMMSGLVLASYDDVDSKARILRQLNQNQQMLNEMVRDLNGLDQSVKNRFISTTKKLSLPKDDLFLEFNKPFKNLVNGETENAYSSLLIKSTGNCVISFAGMLTQQSIELFIDTAKKVIQYPCSSTLVRLNSIGGQVAAGIYLGYAIKANGWDTIAWNKDVNLKDNPFNACNSSCVLAFIGGKNRYVLPLDKLKLTKNEYGFVGIHRGLEKVGDKLVCQSNVSDIHNLLTYQYLKNISSEMAILFISKIINTDCGVFDYLTKSPSDLSLSNFVYTAIFDEQVINRYAFVKK
jgi:hypothetical protein